MFLSHFPPTTEEYYAYAFILCVAALFIVIRNRNKNKQHEEHVSLHHSIDSKPTVESISEISEEGSVDPVSAVAEKLGIPEWQVKTILGIPITGSCPATTAKDAEEACGNANIGSDEEYLAIIKWIELETDFDQLGVIEEIVENSPLEAVLRSKWNKLALKIPLENRSEDELHESFYNTLAGSETEKKIVEKLIELYKV